MDKVGLGIEWDRIRGINGDFEIFTKSTGLMMVPFDERRKIERVVGLGGRKK